VWRLPARLNERMDSRALETDLLTACSRTTFSTLERERIGQLLEQPLDWSFIADEADRHGVLPLLYAALQTGDLVKIVPLESRQRLQACVRTTVGRNLALISELTRILRLFAAENIRALPFKGPVTAMAAYGDCFLRSYSDLDILLDVNDLARASELLAQSGYTPALSLTPREEKAYLKSECALQLQDEVRGFVVELHWRFSERNASVDVPLDEVWERSAGVSLGGTATRTLGLEDLLLYLCVHGAKHCWERLEWISCVAELIARNPALDWSAAVQRSEEWRVARLLHVGLWLVRRLFGTPLPALIENRLDADLPARSLCQTVEQWLFDKTAGTHYQHRAARYRFMLQTRERWSDRFRIVLYSAIKPPHPDAEEWIQLPPRLSFLHHVFRPLRLLSEYSAVAWRHYSGQRHER
jgi:hypothetical protein